MVGAACAGCDEMRRLGDPVRFCQKGGLHGHGHCVTRDLHVKQKGEYLAPNADHDLVQEQVLVLNS